MLCVSRRSRTTLAAAASRQLGLLCRTVDGVLASHLGNSRLRLQPGHPQRRARHRGSRGSSGQCWYRASSSTTTEHQRQGPQRRPLVTASPCPGGCPSGGAPCLPQPAPMPGVHLCRRWRRVAVPQHARRSCCSTEAAARGVCYRAQRHKRHPHPLWALGTRHLRRRWRRACQSASPPARRSSRSCES